MIRVTLFSKTERMEGSGLVTALVFVQSGSGFIPGANSPNRSGPSGWELVVEGGSDLTVGKEYELEFNEVR